MSGIYGMTIVLSGSRQRRDGGSPKGWGAPPRSMSLDVLLKLEATPPLKASEFPRLYFCKTILPMAFRFARLEFHSTMSTAGGKVGCWNGSIAKIFRKSMLLEVIMACCNMVGWEANSILAVGGCKIN